LRDNRIDGFTIFLLLSPEMSSKVIRE